VNVDSFDYWSEYTEIKWENCFTTAMVFMDSSIGTRNRWDYVCTILKDKLRVTC